MSPDSSRRLGYALLIAAALLAAFAYLCSWQAGCHFDSKEGVGDMASATPWSIAGMVAVPLAWVAAALGAAAIAGPTVTRAMGSMLFFGVLLLPLGLLLLLAGGASGVQACAP